MAIYSKPVHQIMKEEMVDGLRLNEGATFTRQQAINWFAHNFSKIKTGTVSAHLIRLSTNAPSRTHYNAKPHEDDVFYQLENGHYRLYDPAQDPKPIRHRGPLDEPVNEAEEALEVESEIPSVGSAEFAYEADLKNYLAKNLYALEAGLRLYEDEGINGIEFPVGGRFIDILAVDTNDDYVVIELKVSRGYDRVAGQLLRYMAWIGQNQVEEGQRVRGIIVAREISKDLKLACSMMTNVELFEYHLSMNLNKVALNG